jgi:hypothetical protein
MLREDYKNTKDRVESPLDTSPVLSALLASAITTRTATAPSHTIYPTPKSALQSRAPAPQYLARYRARALGIRASSLTDPSGLSKHYLSAAPATPLPCSRPAHSTHAPLIIPPSPSTHAAGLAAVAPVPKRGGNTPPVISQGHKARCGSRIVGAPRSTWTALAISRPTYVVQ